MNENNVDLGNFLYEMLTQKTKDLLQEYEIVTGGGFMNYSGAKSTWKT